MSKTSKIVWIVVAIVIVIILIVVVKKGVAPMTKSSETIIVGVIAPLTGPASAYGVEAKNTIVLALDEVNANGGINGHQIEYTVEDGKCDSKAALDAWNKLVQINKVQVVFGGGCSTESVVIAPLTAKEHVLALSVFTTGPKIDNEGEWFFRHISTNPYYATVLAQQAYKSGYRKVAVITEQKEFPGSYSDAFIIAFKKLGGQIVLDERFAPETTDYRTIVSKLKNSGNDSTFISAQTSQTTALVAVQINNLQSEKPTFFNHSFTYAKFIEASKGYFPKTFIAIQPYTNVESPRGQAFNKAYIEKYGSLYTFNSFFITAEYDIVNRFRDAAVKCTEKTLNVDCVRSEFKTVKTYSGVAGDVEISSLYSPFSAITPVSVVTIVNGKEVLVPIK